MAELKRWPARLGLEINVEPAFFPVDDKPAGRLVALAVSKGIDAGPLSERIMSGVWQREENIAEPDVLVGIANELGLDGVSLVEESQGEAADALLIENCEKALAAGCFGVPWYDVGGEPFWGQDRLDFVAERLGAV
jgi:2-hydroxychromene-2-carboxylate isomerase